MVLYHQTTEDFTAFDVGREGAGSSDSEMPTGIFMKPTDSTLRLGLNYDRSKQMPLYASIKRPLVLSDRAAAAAFWEQNVPGYKEKKAGLDALNSKYIRHLRTQARNASCSSNTPHARPSGCRSVLQGSECCDYRRSSSETLSNPVYG